MPKVWTLRKISIIFSLIVVFNIKAFVLNDQLLKQV